MNIVTRMPSAGAGKLAKSLRGACSVMVAPLRRQLADARSIELRSWLFINLSLDVPGADALDRAQRVRRSSLPPRPRAGGAGTASCPRRRPGGEKPTVAGR